MIIPERTDPNTTPYKRATRPRQINPILPMISVLPVVLSRAIYQSTRVVYVERPNAVVVSPLTYFLMIKARQKFIETIPRNPRNQIPPMVTSRGHITDGSPGYIVSPKIATAINPPIPQTVTIQGRIVIIKAFFFDPVAFFMIW